MIITINDRNYPSLLRQIHDQPELLYLQGNPEIFHKPCIAVVGTRRNSEYGKFVTEKIISELARYDVVIVSGLAKGIDAVAHREALKNNLPTIAVLGGGLGQIYPRQNRELASQIAEEGLLVSEYSDDTPPLHFHFPKRNRIISGISLATLVIEAGESSGAMITAKLALDQDREVFTVPGDIDREMSRGPLRLLQKSMAYPVFSGTEIIEILSKQPGMFKKRQLEPAKNTAKTPAKTPTPIKNRLGYYENLLFSILKKTRPTTLETLQEKTSLNISDILINLSFLEIKKLIHQKDDAYFKY